jgi:hypothetical protein
MLSEVSTPTNQLGSTQNLTNAFKQFMKNAKKTPLESIQNFCITNRVSKLIFDYDDTLMKLPKNGLYESNFDKTRFQPFFNKLIKWALTPGFDDIEVCIVTQNNSSDKLNKLFSSLFPGKPIKIYNPNYPKGFTSRSTNDKFDKFEIVSTLPKNTNAMYFEDDLDLLNQVMRLTNIACVHVTIGEHPSEQTDFYELHMVPKSAETLPVIGKKRSPPKKKIPDPTGMGTKESREESEKEASAEKPDDYKLKTVDLTNLKSKKPKQKKGLSKPRFASDSEKESSVDSIENSVHSDKSSSIESQDWDRYMGIDKDTAGQFQNVTNNAYGSPIYSSPKTGKKTVTQKKTMFTSPVKDSPIENGSPSFNTSSQIMFTPQEKTVDIQKWNRLNSLSPSPVKDSPNGSPIFNISSPIMFHNTSSPKAPIKGRKVGIQNNRITKRSDTPPNTPPKKNQLFSSDSDSSPIHSSPKTGRNTVTQKKTMSPSPVKGSPNGSPIFNISSPITEMFHNTSYPKAPIKGRKVGSQSNRITKRPDTPPKKKQLFSSDSDSSPKRTPKVPSPKKTKSFRDKLNARISYGRKYKDTTESKDDMMADIKLEKGFYSRYPKHQIVPRIDKKFQYDDPIPELKQMARNRSADKTVLHKTKKFYLPINEITKILNEPGYQVQDPGFFMPRRRIRSHGGKRRINKTRKLF